MNKADKIIAAAKLLNDSCVFGYHECYDVYPDALKGVDGVRMSADGEKLIYQHDGGEITCFLNTVEAVRWREEHPKEAIE